MLLSGVARSGVNVIVSVTDWPMASETGVKPVTVKPDDPAAARVTLFSGTLPALVSVSVAVIPAPGGVLTAVGVAVMVRASTAGMVNDSVWVCVIEGAAAGCGDGEGGRGSWCGDGGGGRLEVDADDAGLAGGDRDAGPAFEESEAGGDVRERQVVGVRRRAVVVDDDLEGALGNCSPLNGTLMMGSGLMASVNPACVGLMVTLTTVCATRLGLVADWARTWTGYVPP